MSVQNWDHVFVISIANALVVEIRGAGSSSAGLHSLLPRRRSNWCRLLEVPKITYPWSFRNHGWRPLNSLPTTAALWTWSDSSFALRMIESTVVHTLFTSLYQNVSVETKLASCSNYWFWSTVLNFLYQRSHPKVLVRSEHENLVDFWRVSTAAILISTNNASRSVLWMFGSSNGLILERILQNFSTQLSQTLDKEGKSIVSDQLVVLLSYQLIQWHFSVFRSLHLCFRQHWYMALSGHESRTQKKVPLHAEKQINGVDWE